MEANHKLDKSLSPVGAWAFSIGTSLGWGALVVTSSTYLAQSGPWGSAIGMLIGGLVMLIISANYAYLMNIYPDAGGAYAYTRKILGHDYAFLTAWFLSLTYMAILWANVTSIPLLMRYFLGDVFRVGRLYALFGYNVYLGEALLSIAALIVVAALCAHRKRIMARAMIAMGFVFSIGIAVCFFTAIAKHSIDFHPNFVPDASRLSQIVGIAVISPWAFIGFENISHATEEARFTQTRFFRILLISVISTTALYIFVTLLSATAYPPEYGSWLEYIRQHDALEGLKGLPAFYAAQYYMGDTGVLILMLSLVSLIVTSLIGNITAVSRLFLALGRDGVMPRRFGKLNRHNLPGKAILLIAAVSALFPFLGRTAIGWIVDVTTIGATLIYGLVSFCVFRLSRERKDRVARRTGLAGFALMIAYGLYLLVPNLYTASSMARESYFLFLVWAVLGFIYFRVLLVRDTNRRFGRSIVVWIALFSLVLFISVVYLCQSVMQATESGMLTIQQYYIRSGSVEVRPALVRELLEQIRKTTSVSVTAILALIAVSIGALITNYRIISSRAQHSEIQLGQTRELVSRDPLTGVKSRHAFAEKERELDAQIAAGQPKPFALAVCDLNGLKYYNDQFGHQAGDERIKQACKVICDLFSHSPVFRNGGDEFVVLLTGRDYEDRHNIMAALHEKSVANIESGEVVISAGISDFNAQTDTRLHAVFERADAAMYAEKKLLKGMGARTR